MVDPRMSVVRERLRGVRRIVAVSGGKGGVGKSLFATTFALVLAGRGFRVGLFDLDFTSPSTHAVLGVGELRPVEEKGIVPPRVCGLEYMSIVYYSGGHATPLRGDDVSNALLELLSVVVWGELDFLVLDLPPGIGDATLDLVRWVERVEFLIVTIPSRLAFETVRRLAGLLQALRVRVIGVVENMELARSDAVERETDALGLKFLGRIPFDQGVEKALGKPDELLKTVFGEKVRQVALRI